MKLITLIFLSFLSTSIWATFVPEDQIDYAKLTKGNAQITQAEFDLRIKALQDVYTPIVSHHRGRLSLKGLWTNDRIVARATQMFGSWKVEFSGGLARRPELTPDGMTLIICHEIGHHLGGFPFAGGSPLGGYWAAVEGQSDYYSTQVCARKMWSQETEINASFAGSVKPFARAQCDLTFQSVEDRNLCYRTTVASESVILTMATLMNKPVPTFETPDATVRTATIEGHPAVQCRMDTLFQGSICAADFDDQLIPGRSAAGGRDGMEAEREAAMQSCSALDQYARGLRPACWFKARL